MEPFVVGLLDTHHVVRVATTTDLAKFLRNKRDRKQYVLPVFAIRADGVEWAAATSLPLPLTCSLSSAASVFGSARLDVSAQRVVFRHVRRLPAGLAVRLLSDWRDAVAAASVDAPGVVEVTQGGRA